MPEYRLNYLSCFLEKTMRLFRVSVVFCAVLFLSISSAFSNDKPDAVSGEGKLYKIDGFSVLELHGSYYEMGKQYGELLGDDIKSIARLIDFGLNQTIGAERTKNAKTVMQKQLEQYPKRFQDVLQGMADGSGASMEEIALTEHVISILCAAESGIFCSSLTAWGDYTSDGKLIMGRNFEFPNFYVAFTNKMCLVVFNPSDGSVPTAVFGFAGQVGTVQAFNRSGLVQELNIGLGFDKDNYTVAPDRITIMILLVQLAMDSTNLEQMEAGIKTVRSNFPLLNTIADSKRARTCEMGTRDVKLREIDTEGLNITTNFVAHPAWGKHMYSDHRQGYLRKSADESKGKLDIETIKAIISVPSEEGGVLAVNQKFFDVEELGGSVFAGVSTIFQFVYVPADQKLSLRVPSQKKKWTEIDLNRYFAP